MNATPFDHAPDNDDRGTPAEDVGMAAEDVGMAAEATQAAEHAAAAAVAAAADIADRVAERLEGLAEEIHVRISGVLHTLPERLAAAGLQPDEIDHIRAGIEQAGERAAARIEHKVAHVVARARVLAQRGERRVRRERG